MEYSSNFLTSHSVEGFFTKKSKNDFQNEKENKVRSVTVDDKILKSRNDRFSCERTQCKRRGCLFQNCQR